MFKGKDNMTSTPTCHYGAYDVVFAGKGQTKWTKTNGWYTYRSLIKKQTPAYKKLTTKKGEFALRKIVKPILDLGGNFYKLGSLEPMAEEKILSKVTQSLRDSKSKLFSRKMAERKLPPLTSITIPHVKLQTQPIFNTKCSSLIINDTPPRSASDINTPMIVNLNVPVRHHQNQHTSRTVLYDINNNQQIVDVFETEGNQHLSCKHESANVNTVGRQQLSHVSMSSSSPNLNTSSNSSYGSSPCYSSSSCYGSSPKPNPSLCPNPHPTSIVCQTSESSLGQCSRSMTEMDTMQDSLTPDEILSYLDLNELEEEFISLSNTVSYGIFDNDEPSLDFRTV
jgi:hypothetical protein